MHSEKCCESKAVGLASSASRSTPAIYPGNAVDTVQLEPLESPVMKAILALSCRVALSAIVTVLACALKPVAPPPVGVPAATSSFVLGRSTPVPPGNYEMAALLERFPAFQSQPASNAFAHVVLPFKGGPSEDDKYKAFAFSFLLSNALDWGPGCFCARHAYFTFKRSGLAALDAGKTLRPSAIAQHAARWKATHVIGGDLVSGKRGWTGTLKVFDPAGALLREKRFKTPQPYFTLLGDMSVESLRAIGYEPSPALVAHLHVPRCTDESLLTMLGRAAFEDERSPAEFELYRRILEKEPGFAEVRYWWGNQSAWVTHDSAAYYRQLTQSIGSYMTPTAMADVYLGRTDERQGGLGYDRLIAEVDRLIGPDTPLAWHLRFKKAREHGTPTTLAEAQAATQVAARYPEEFKLLLTLMGSTRDGTRGLWEKDFSMIASLSLATLRCRALPSAYTSRRAAFRFGEAARAVGYPEMAAQSMGPLFAHAMSVENTNNVIAYGWPLAEVLQDMGQYEASFQVGMATVAACTDDNKYFYLLNALISGLLAGRTNEVEKLAVLHASGLASNPLLGDLLNAYRAMGAGDCAAVEAYAKVAPVKASEADIRVGLDRVMLYAELDLKQGRSDYRGLVRESVCLHPALRPLWVLFDAYDRAKPSAEDEGFYETLGWLHRDDPWVMQAIAARSHRIPSPPEFNLKAILASLDAYPPPRWPVGQDRIMVGSGSKAGLVDPPSWEHTRAIKRMMAMKEYERADEFARQCISAAIGLGTLETHFTHLYHLVQDARAKEPATKTRTLPPPPDPWPARTMSPVLKKMLENDGSTKIIYR